MISITTKYALRTLLYLRDQAEESYIALDILAEKTAIPRRYLGKLIKTLAKKDLVQTKKGTGGGVKISQTSFSESFYDICTTLDDPIVRESCFLMKAKCNPDSPCPFHPHWKKTREQLEAFLKSSNIQSYIEAEETR